jgi:hypothetical protein
MGRRLKLLNRIQHLPGFATDYAMGCNKNTLFIKTIIITAGPIQFFERQRTLEPSKSLPEKARYTKRRWSQGTVRFAYCSFRSKWPFISELEAREFSGRFDETFC